MIQFSFTFPYSDKGVVLRREASTRYSSIDRYLRSSQGAIFVGCLPKHTNNPNEVALG